MLVRQQIGLKLPRAKPKKSVSLTNLAIQCGPMDRYGSFQVLRTLGSFLAQLCRLQQPRNHLHLRAVERRGRWGWCERFYRLAGGFTLGFPTWPTWLPGAQMRGPAVFLEEGHGVGEH